MLESATMFEQSKRVRRKRRRKNSRLRRTQIRSAVVLALLILAGFAAGFFVFSSVHKAWNRWRESRLLTQADDLLRGENPEDAEAIAHKALTIDPNSITAFRILAEAAEKQNRNEALAWRSQIARLDPRLDSQLNLASAALRFGQLEVARSALERVAPNDREKAAYQVVAGWLSRAQGNVSEEERHFAAAVAREPGNDLYQFNLAVLQILSPDPEKNASARDQLERLSKVAQFRSAALRALLDNALRQNQIEAADELAQELQMSQEVTFSDYLLCLELYRKLNPKKFEALLEKVKPVATRNGNDLAELIDWMNKNRLAADALKWSEKLAASLTSRPPAVVAIAETLAETKNWSRLKRWTRSGSWGDEDYLRLAYQAYAARESRRSASDAEFDSLWSSAERDAASNPERELALARLSSRWNLTEEAERLWLRVAKVSAARREALNALYRIYRAANDLPNLRLTAQRLHESSPEEIGLATDAARFALLLDRNTAEGRELAKQAYEKEPNDTAAAVTYAFALYGTGRTAEGIEILKNLAPDQLRDPHAAAYTALLLDDENQVEAANQYIALARAGPLFPEEKQLLDEIATRRQGATPTPSASASPNESAASTAPTP
jgi:predicted Zn-dependent protease